MASQSLLARPHLHLTLLHQLNFSISLIVHSFSLCFSFNRSSRSWDSLSTRQCPSVTITPTITFSQQSPLTLFTNFCREVSHLPFSPIIPPTFPHCFSPFLLPGFHTSHSSNYFSHFSRLFLLIFIARFSPLPFLQLFLPLFHEVSPNFCREVFPPPIFPLTIPTWQFCSGCSGVPV